MSARQIDYRRTNRAFLANVSVKNREDFAKKDRSRIQPVDHVSSRECVAFDRRNGRGRMTLSPRIRLDCGFSLNLPLDAVIYAICTSRLHFIIRHGTFPRDLTELT